MAEFGPFTYLAFKGDSQTTAGLIQAQFLSGSHEISLENGLHIATRESPSSRLTSILRSIRSSRVHKGVKNLDDWSEIIRERLVLWGWPCRAGLDSIEYQQFQRFDASLDALVSLSAVLPHQTYESALSLWRECLISTVFQPKTPNDSIQVLGPLEAIGVNLTHFGSVVRNKGCFQLVREWNPFYLRPFRGRSASGY